MSQRKFGIALLITALLCVIPASVAYASITAISSHNSSQSISTSNWSANAGLNSSAMPTGFAYGPIIPSNPNNCPTSPPGSCTWDEYLSINNTGLTDIGSFTMTATSDSTLGESISLVACLGGTWNESTGECSGSVQTLTTTIGSGTGANSPQNTWVTIPLAASESIRLRAISTQSGSSLTVGVSVARVNLRTTTSNNG